MHIKYENTRFDITVLSLSWSLLCQAIGSVKIYVLYHSCTKIVNVTLYGDGLRRNVENAREHGLFFLSIYACLSVVHIEHRTVYRFW